MISATKLLVRLCDASKSGVYRVSDDEAIREAVAAGKHDFAVIELAGEKEALLEAIARSLEFPGWFGGNWDALEDCLTDLSWRKGSDRVVMFSGALQSQDLGILVDVLSSSAQFWREKRRAFFAVFVDPENMLKLPDLYCAGTG